METIFLWAGIGYFLGAIPFGLLLTYAAGGGDIRAIGSGNIGATNVLRSGRKGVAAATLLLDIGKGALAVWLARHFAGTEFAAAGGAGAFIGHVYPLWLRFRGGKGVATLLGVSLMLHPLAGLAFAVAWAGLALGTRISSVGGMAGGFAAAAALYALDARQAALVVLVLALWVVRTHHQNIRRLLAGTEPRIGRKA